MATSTSAQAWGGSAHQIICEIAFQELNDKARAEVIRLMEDDKDFTQFNASCLGGSSETVCQRAFRQDLSRRCHVPQRNLSRRRELLVKRYQVRYRGAQDNDGRRREAGGTEVSRALGRRY